tara:strand:+ start:1138 stop:1494 length:357 start_codon:yes stop_codon:yes gene_type:complete
MNILLILLNKLFPQHISFYIIKIIKNDNLKILCFSKCFTLEMMMENIVKHYSYEKNYNMICNIENIKQIYNLHKFVLNNNNHMLINIQNLIDNYYKILKYHNDYQEKWIKKILEKYII